MIEEYLLTEICLPRQWRTIPTKNLKEEGYPVYGANGIIGFYNEYTHEDEALLITCRGATCGTLNISKPFSYVNGNAMALDNLNKDKVNLKYLYYFLKKRGLQDVISGSAQPQITRTNLAKVKVPLPDLNTQIRIVEVLDKAQSLIDKRKAQVTALSSLSQSIFFEEFGDTAALKKVKISQLINSLEAGLSTGGESREKKDGEYGVLTVSAVTKGIFNSKAYKVPTKNLDHKSKIVHPTKNSILVSRANTRELVGASCIIENDYQDLFIPDKIWKLSLKLDQVNPYYFIIYIQQESFRKKLSKEATGTSGSMLNISQQKFKDMEIFVPELDRQNVFANILRKVSTTKMNIENSLVQLENKFQALLQSAFNGKLFN